MRKPAVDVDAELANLRSTDWKVRSATAQILGKSKDAAAVEPLIRALSTDTSFTVRSRAAVSLGKLKDVRATEALIGAMSAGNWQLFKHAFSAITKLGPKAIPLLTQYAQDQTQTDSLRGNCIGVIGQIGTESAVEALLPLISEPDFMVRLEAIRTLGRLKAPAAFEPLLQALQNPQPFTVTGPAAMVAGMQFSMQPALLQTLVESLSEFEDERVVKPFVALLDNREAFGPDTEMLLAVTNGLRRLSGFKGKDYVELAAASQSHSPHIRLAAALSLSWLRDRRGLEPLRVLTQDESPEVQIAAVWSLLALETTLGYGIPNFPLATDYMLR